MADDNPYIGIVRNDAKSTLRKSLAGAVDTNADQESELQKLGKVYGIPPAAVRADPERFKRRAQIDSLDYDDIVKSTPTTAAYLSDPQNAKVAHDDLDVLGHIEKTFRNLGGLGAGAVTSVGAGLMGLTGAAYDVIDPLGFVVGPGSDWRRQNTAVRQQLMATTKDVTPQVENPWLRGINTGIQSTLAQAPLIVAGVVTKQPGVALGGMGAIAAGSAYGEAQDAGKGTIQSLAHAAAQGGIEVATERLPVTALIGDVAKGTGAIKTLMKQFALDAPGEQLATLWQDLNDWATGTEGNADKTFADYLRERPDRFAETLVASAVGASASTVTQQLAVAAERRGQESIDAQEAEAGAETIKAMVEAAAQSKLRERDPGAFERFVAEATADGPASDVYISAQALAQSGVDLEDLAATLPSAAGQLAEALQSGGDLKIPMSEFATYAAGTPLAQTLVPHLRVDPGAFSQSEAQDALKTQGEALRADVEQVIATAQDTDAFKASADRVRDSFAEQLNTAARFSPDVNRNYAQLMGSFYAVNAARVGVTPEELLARYPLTIRAEALRGEAATLDQEGDPLFHGSSTEGLTSLEPSTRGALGPGVYFTPNQRVAERYGDALYSALEPAGVFQGIKSNDSSVNPYEVWRDQVAQLVTAATPEQAAEINEISGRMQPSDGYPFFKRVAQVMGSEEAAQDLFKRAGFTGISGIADGPEVVIFDATDVAQFNEALDTFQQRTRGSFSPSTSTIVLNKTADLSTFLHEAGHFYLETLADMASRPDAPAEIQQDFDAVLKWFSAMDDAPAAVAGENLAQMSKADFDALLAEVREKSAARKALAETLSATEMSVRLTHTDGRKALVSPDLENPGGWRFTRIDDQGPAGHTEHATKYEAVLEALQAHYAPPQSLAQNGEQGAPTTGPITRKRWAAMSLDEQRFYHERFARGFEAYLFEGKAPSTELKGVFRRFRAWLLDVYRSALSAAGDIAGALDVKLTPDMRAVFDRMLASSQQIIQQERAQGALPLVTTAEEAQALGMSPDEWAAYQTLGVTATQEAIEGLERRSLRDMQWLSNAKDRTIRKLQAEANDKRKAIRDEVTAEVMAEPINRARTFLKRGLGADGQPVVGPHKLALADVKAMYEGRPPELVDFQRLGYGRYGMLAEQGLAPDVVAEMFGFPSGEDLIESLLNAEPAAEKIAGLVDQRMLERHGDLTDRDAIERAADEAIHNDARLRFVATEASALQKAVGAGRFLSTAAKDFATGMVGRLAIKDLKPHRFRTAESRAAAAADKAFKAGDLAGAAVEKRNQLINGYATRAAYDAQAEVQKGLNAFRRIVNAKDETAARNRDMDLVNAARGVLAAYGIGRADKAPGAYLEVVKRLDPALYADIEPFLANAANNARNWRGMSYEEFQGLRTTVNQLWFLSKRVKQIDVDGELRDREAVAAELGARLDALGVPTERPGVTSAVTDSQRRLRMLSGWRAAARRVESWARYLDGADTGPFRKYLWQMVSEPADRYRTEKQRVMASWLEIVKAVEPTLKPMKIAAPELGYTFGGKAEVLHAILHTGNESNKRKLLLGRRWATETAEGELGTARWDAFVARMIAEGRLTQADYDFAQATWDLLDTLKEGAQRAHRTVYGRYFEEVTADPFDTPFGRYRGGYVPALTDSFLVQDQALRAEEEAINGGDHAMFPSPAKGFTMSRVDYNRELALDLRLLPSHIDKVLKFTHFGPPVRDVMRLLKEKGFASKLEAFDPVAQSDLLLPWLNRSAKQIVETPMKGEAGRGASNFFRALRQRTGMGVMFANLTNAMQQATGFTVAAVRVRPALLAGALWQYVRDPTGVAETVDAASEFMAQRNSAQMFEIGQTLDAILLDPNVYQKAQGWTAKHGYFLQTAVQNVVDRVTWLGAFNQAIERGENDKEAVRIANSVVRETQGSLSPEDVSRFETGTAFARLFTQFQSFFNMQANLLGTEFALAARDLGLRKGAGRMLYVYLFGFMAPAVVAEAIVTSLKGGVEDDEEDGPLDEMLAKFFSSQGRFGLAMVPYVGTVANAVFSGFNDKPYDDRISTAPAVSSVENAARAPSEVYKAIAEDGDRSKALKDTLTAMTLLTGIPFQAVARPAGYLTDVLEGDVEPTSAADFGRGLITGAPSPESRQ